MKFSSIVPRQGKMLKPFVDWAFKYIFGREESKSLTMGFLNLIIKSESPIIDISFLPNESVPNSESMKRSVFDILCEDEEGNKFLVEMQNAEAANIENRIIYYTCRLVDQMGVHSSDWEYEIRKVYAICLMNYTIGPDPILRSDVVLYNLSRREIYSDRLNIIMFQIPCVKASNIDEAQEIYEKMLYLLHSMQDGTKTLEELKMEVERTNSLEAYTKRLFSELMEVADYASLSDADRAAYDAKLKVARDNAACLSFARQNGLEEGVERGFRKGLKEGEEIGRSQGLKEGEEIGRSQGLKEGEEIGRSQGLKEGEEIGRSKGLMEGVIQTARALKSKKYPLIDIMECTGLTKEQVESL